MVSVLTPLFILVFIAILTMAQLKAPKMESESLSLANEVVEAVMSRVSMLHCTVLFFTDATTSSTTFFNVINHLRASRGVGVFEAASNGHDKNKTLFRLMSEARRLRQISLCVTVAVVSDDSAFLAAFAEWSLKGRLLQWSTRLLAVTRLPLSDLHHLHEFFSINNAMLLIMENNFGKLKCGVYVHMPYRHKPPVIRVASWTPEKHLKISGYIPLFPEKFYKFPHLPSFEVAMDERLLTRAFMKDDETAPGGKRLWFKGPSVDLLDYLAKAFNFTYTFVKPSDGSTGSKKTDGSWSGIVGMVMRGETHFAVGPFSVTASRSQVVDLTTPISMSSLKFLGGLGRSEVNPWSFLLPYTSLVWATILATLLVLLVTTFIFSLYFFIGNSSKVNRMNSTFNLIQVLLQQDYHLTEEWWWWERVVLAVWMLMTLVLTRSYAGNLISHLAVRYIPKPYVNLRELVDDKSGGIIWQQDSSTEQYIRSKEMGILKEVADLEQKGRARRIPVKEFYSSIDNFVKRGDHVIILYDEFLSILLGQQFSNTGRCDLYLLKDKIKPSMAGMMVPKDSPFLPPFNDRALALNEFGLYEYWIQSAIPNYTACLDPPTKISVSNSLSISNLWGIFVVLFGGFFVSLIFLGFETLL